MIIEDGFETFFWKYENKNNEKSLIEYMSKGIPIFYKTVVETPGFLKFCDDKIFDQHPYIGGIIKYKDMYLRFTIGYQIKSIEEVFGENCKDFKINVTEHSENCIFSCSFIIKK